MSLKRIPENSKFNFETKLFPRRVFTSGSSGTTGAVYVFPNRSELQKDNIDERLEFAPIVDGEQIKPFDADSLEARRIQIYSGDFANIVNNGNFSDATVYTYIFDSQEYTGDDINSMAFLDGDTILRTSDQVNFIWSSLQNGFWRTENTNELYNRVPVTNRDQNSKNYEPALAILIDGANPQTQDHAWRFGLSADDVGIDPRIDVVNDSITSGNLIGVYSGYKTEYDDSGFPFLGDPIDDPADLNPWPPEIEKWNAQVGAFVSLGYSDLSMHPRNMTKKEITKYRADNDAFSRGSLLQKTAYILDNSKKDNDSGWWVDNRNSISLCDYEFSGNQYKPAIIFDNRDEQFSLLENDGFTIEFWIKPDSSQTDIGTIFYLAQNYAVTLEPMINTMVDNVYQYYKIGIYWGANVTNQKPAIADFYSSGIIKVNNWHNIKIRRSLNFNNGNFDVFIDDIKDVTFEGGSFIRDEAFRGDVFSMGAWITEDHTSSQWGILGRYINYQYSGQNETEDPNFSFFDGVFFSTDHRLKSQLAKLCCYNSALTQLEFSLYKNDEPTDYSVYNWYWNFIFNPREEDYFQNRFRYQGNSTVDNLQDYYKSGAAYLTTKHLSKVQYDVNSGHTVGMPFILLHSHLGELVSKKSPVITGIPQTTDISSYPNSADYSYSVDKLLYFIENWKNLSWLLAMNSIIRPSDCPYRPHIEFYSSSINNYLGKKDTIWYASTGIGEKTINSIMHAYDDEAYSFNISGYDWSQEQIVGFSSNSPTRSDFNTVAMWDKFSDSDFLPPFSIILNIPVLYYGSKINPGSFSLETKDSSGKSIKIVDKENKLYISNSKNGSKVGYISYDKGIIVIYHPFLSCIAMSEFTCKFEGSKSMYVKQYDIKLGKSEGIISNNVSWKPMTPSSNANDQLEEIVIVSDIYLHDNNLNVLAKAKLANPIIKRKNDSFMFRIKLDF